MSELHRLEKKLKRGQITRREFLSRMTAMGLVAAALALYSGSALAGPKKCGRLMDGSKFVERWWFA